jgi:hypothetical protein
MGLWMWSRWRVVGIRPWQRIRSVKAEEELRAAMLVVEDRSIRVWSGLKATFFTKHTPR